MIVKWPRKNKVRRCKKCNEPLHAHPGSQYKFWIRNFEGKNDIIKAKNWHSSNEEDWKKSWIGRDVFLSVRLISLLRKISAKGIYQYREWNAKPSPLTKAEKEWIENALIKIGKLANNKPIKEVTPSDFSKVMTYFKVKKIDTKRVEYFKKRFKTDPSKIAKVLCSVEKSTTIRTGGGEVFKIEEIKDWQTLKRKKKLISFAYDEFGNSLQFDPEDKQCAIYYYDHETMLSELSHSSILDLLKQQNRHKRPK